MNCRHVAMLATLVMLGCSAAIQQGLDETAADEVLASLERAGIAASKSRADDGAFTVSVASADAPGAIELLRSLGLPRGKRPGFGEVYQAGSLIPTPTDERARYVEALAGEVARTLETFDSVLLARVHLVLPEPDPLALDGKPRVAAQAAVLLKLRPGRPSPVTEADVQKLVAGSVPGLTAAAVAVVVTTAAAPPAPQATLVTLGPLRLTPHGRTTLVAVGAVAFATVVVLAALVLLLARRLAAGQKKG